MHDAVSLHHGAAAAVARALLSGGDPNGDGELLSNDVTPLMSAASIGNAEVVALLLRAGARVDAESSFGKRALACAAGEGRLGALKLLLAGGADCVLSADDGRTALDLARAAEHAPIVAILKEAVALAEGADAAASASERRAVDSLHSGVVAEVAAAKAEAVRPKAFHSGAVARPQAYTVPGRNTATWTGRLQHGRGVETRDVGV